MYIKDDDMDSFWDVSRLVPKKKSAIGRFSTSEKMSDVVIGNGSEARSIPDSERKISFSAFSSARTESAVEERSYVPSGSRLIKRVTIKPSVDRFDFYDTFRKAALIYYDYKCDKCDFTAFYSYKPQYSQMSNEQKHYYFYWRDELRRGRYIRTDYSYIYLYAYEILNLPEKISATEGLRLLCDVWSAYREQLPRLDASFSCWVQDYCLVYGLDCPHDRIGGFLFDVINASTFKEFYLSDHDGDGNGSAAMIAYLSDYDWRRGKYAGGEHAEMYRTNMEGAMQRVFARLLSEDLFRSAEPTKVTRTAFAGSLCTHSVKCLLEIEYYSVADSPDLRRAVTAAIKYTENKLRACLGVKSRLAVKDLDESLKAIIDRYFAAEFEKLRRKKEKENEPEYERLYDSSEERISFADAIEIERASWRVTARLVEGIEDYEEEETEQTKETTASPDTVESAGGDKNRYGLCSDDIEFLRAIAEGRASASADGFMPELAAERINEAFADNYGDVILEDDGNGGFCIIEDYYEEIIEWLR